MLPTIYQWAGDVLPLRYITDGVRAIMFSDGNGAAGLTRAIIALAIMAVVGVILSGIIARWKEFRMSPEVSSDPVPSVAATW